MAKPDFKKLTTYEKIVALYRLVEKLTMQIEGNRVNKPNKPEPFVVNRIRGFKGGKK